MKIYRVVLDGHKLAGLGAQPTSASSFVRRIASIFQRSLRVVFSLGLIYLFIPLSSQAKEIRCLTCHGAKDLQMTDEYGRKVSLYIDPSIIKSSIHKDLTCIDCHTEVKDEVHMVKPGIVQCGRCHKATLLEYRESFHGRKYIEGVKDAPWCQDCHGSHDIRSRTDPSSLTYRLNIPKMCDNCHKSAGMAKKYNLEVSEPYKLYRESIHGKAIVEKGLINAAICTDCHEAHALKEPTDPSALIYRYNVPSTCGKCHYGDYQVFEESVHGKAVLAGNPKAPVCTDCHSEHSIQPPWVKTSTVYPANISRTTCPWCHSAEKLTDRYGIIARRETPYLDSYHGVDSRAGWMGVANCASCHGYHDVRPSSDPRSSINPANLAKTCGNCHPNAGVNFTKGKVHIAISPKSEIGVYIVRRIYIVLIVLIIGGMVLHNSLIILKRVKEKYKEAKEGTVIRFNQGEIIQHLLLFLTFTTLAVSGFALKFPNAWWARWMVQTEAGAHLRSDIHRIAAVIFILVCMYNLYYMLFTQRGKAQLRAILFIPKDIPLVIQNINYYLGLSRERPRFDRYGYMEKAEYWALIWGAVVMTITGFPMWFENFFLKYIPLWLLNVFRAIHLYEAILASTAIVVWHLFFMIFEPDSYPVNLSMMTGRITEKELEEKHPAEYERLKDKDKFRLDKEE